MEIKFCHIVEKCFTGSIIGFHGQYLIKMLFGRAPVSIEIIIEAMFEHFHEIKIESIAHEKELLISIEVILSRESLHLHL